MTGLQTEYADAFAREYGCTEADWLRWLPGAVGACRLELQASRRAAVMIGRGRLELNWQPLPARKIASVEFPRQQVDFKFDSVEATERRDFMRYFDLYLQRGGG